MNRAFIFPGQGSQYIGMGKDFFDSEPIAKQIFNIVDESVGYNLSNIIFNGTSEELAITTNTQPAIMAVSIAIVKVLQAKTKKNIDELCNIMAGHSLGEYSALCASGVIDIDVAAKLLKIRSNAMQTASPQGQGAMAACIGVSYSELKEMLDSFIVDGVCQIANDNVDGQIVISGHTHNVDLIINLLKEKQFRAIKLNVSAPFHSLMMKDAEATVKDALLLASFTTPTVPVISNVNVCEESDIEQIKTNLIDQICGTVRWRETMDYLVKKEITELVEIGPGNVLSNLAKRSKHNFKIYSIANVSDLEHYLSEH